MQYLCNCCRKEIVDLPDLLFVENDSSRYFCSENCIEKFFTPLVSHYNALEDNLRREVGVTKDNDSTALDYLGDSAVMDRLLYTPTEIWVDRNVAGEEVYHFLSLIEGVDNGPLYGVVVALVREFSPSFILSATVTKSLELFNKYRLGMKIDDISSYLKRGGEQISEMALDEEIFNSVERLKSELLATHLELRSENDVPYEDFYLYEECLSKTMENPDAVYYHQLHGQELLSYMKSGSGKHGAFFYIVICLRLADDAAENNLVVPVFSFPTIDGDLYQQFCEGTQVFGDIKS